MADNRNQSPGQPQGQSKEQRPGQQAGQQGGQSPAQTAQKSATKNPAEQPGPQKDKQLGGQERSGHEMAGQHNPSRRAEPGYSSPDQGGKERGSADKSAPAKGETEGTRGRQDKPGGMGGQGGERPTGRQ